MMRSLQAVLVAAVLSASLAGCPTSRPESVIDSPASGLVIVAGESVSFAGSGSSPGGFVPLTYVWNFAEASSGVPPSTAEDPGPVTFPTPGIFTVKLTARDSHGQADVSPATVTVVVRDAPVVIDNTDPGFASAGSWVTATDADGFYGTNFLATNPGSGTRTATWTFSIPAAGEYAVSAQWGEASWAAEDAPYTLYNNGLDLGTVRVDQRTAGGRFNLLGTPVLEAGTLEVILSNAASQWVVADAVQVSGTALAIVSPAYNALSTASDVFVSVETLGLPASWGVELVVDGDVGAPVPIPSPPFIETLEGLALAEHVVDAFLLDEHGQQVPSLATQVRFGVGDYYVAFGDSITDGHSDNVSTDDVSLDRRDSHRGFSPVLNDELTVALGYPHAVKANGVSGSQSGGTGSIASGVTRIPGVLAAYPDAQAILILFGTNDAWWVQRPSGLGLSPGEPGYAGSYKDYMTQIIEAVIADGREPILAKAPPFFGTIGGPTPVPVLNALVQGYNEVVDELVVEFSIPVTPPDFYVHFEAHPEEIADDVHPNGVGYQSMAGLWADALTP